MGSASTRDCILARDQKAAPASHFLGIGSASLDYVADQLIEMSHVAVPLATTACLVHSPLFNLECTQAQSRQYCSPTLRLHARVSRQAKQQSKMQGASHAMPSACQHIPRFSSIHRSTLHSLTLPQVNAA